MAATITTSPIKFPTEFDLDAKDLVLKVAYFCSNIRRCITFHMHSY